MSTETFLALIVFSFVTSITPGPNNFMLMASGVNFGFYRTVPHMLGIGVGFFALLLAVGLGLGALLTAVPALHLALKIAGSLYLVYLAWRIATAATLKKAETAGTPMTFLEAAAFQWVNPKAWVMAITAMAIYTSPTAPFLSVMLVALAFALVNVPCVSVWTLFGMALRTFLSDPARLIWFNHAMGALLVASLIPMVM